MKYIDSEKLIAEIERRKKQDVTFRERSILIDIETAIESLQQEQPMPDSTKLIELWHEDKEMLKEKDFRDDPWRLAYNAFMCGFGRGLAINMQEHPFPRWIHANYSSKPEIRHTPSGTPYLQNGPYMIWLSDLETLPKDGTDLTNPGPVRLPEVDFEKEYKSYMQSRKDDLSGNAVTVNMKDLSRHFYGLRNRALEEAARHVYESWWMGGTMDDIRWDMVELGKVLNARKEE